jgi:hypothetical protein
MEELVGKEELEELEVGHIIIDLVQIMLEERGVLDMGVQVAQVLDGMLVLLVLGVGKGIVDMVGLDIMEVRDH